MRIVISKQEKNHSSRLANKNNILKFKDKFHIYFGQQPSFNIW